MGIAPSPQFPERVKPVFEREMAPALTGQRGPLRFEEGIGTDTDVPNEFAFGVSQGYEVGARPNHNKNVFEKLPEETMRERAHVGSAAWVEAPELLSDFSSAGFQDYGSNHFDEVIRNGSHQNRSNPAVVND